MRTIEKCQRCGRCCTVGWVQDIFEIDLVREPRLRPHVMPVERLEEHEQPRYFLQSPCPFVVKGGCSIYPTRPNICVAYESGSTPLCPLSPLYDCDGEPEPPEAAGDVKTHSVDIYPANSDDTEEQQDRDYR